MDARELRIGNWFEWDSLASMGVGQQQIEKGEEIDSYNNFKNPIPLTEEWLLKFGFEKFVMMYDETRVYSTSYFNDFLDIKILKNGKTFIRQSRCYEYRLTSHIQFVHQLQNLYFALTDKELELKKETV